MIRAMTAMRAVPAAALSALLLVPFAGARAQRQAPPAPGTPKPFTLPPRHEFTLPNGMGVTFVQYGIVPKVNLDLVLRTGSDDEAPNEIWLSRLMGDLMQQGTTTRSAVQIASDAADLGGSVSVSVGVVEMEIEGSALGEFAPRLVALVADVARHPTFPDSELPRLKADRLRQLAIAKSQPQPLAQEKFRAVLYPESPYGRVYPTPAMLQGYTTPQIRAFYDAHVSAARAHLYVVGRFDQAAVERAVRQAFGDWQRGAPPAMHPAAGTSTREIHLIDRPGAVQSTLYIGLPVPDPSSPDYLALEVTDALLGGAFTSRITSNIREQKGYTYSPFSTIASFYRAAYWAEIADVTTNVTGAAIKEIFGEIDRLRNTPPSAEELRGIQNYLAGTFVLQNSSRAGIISQLDFVRLHGLSDDYLTNYVKNVYAVTPATVQQMAQQYLDPNRMTLVVVGDKNVIAAQLAPYGKIVE
jgi:predicted Zn-dependent peptidase